MKFIIRIVWVIGLIFIPAVLKSFWFLDIATTPGIPVSDGDAYLIGTVATLLNFGIIGILIWWPRVLFMLLDLGNVDRTKNGETEILPEIDLDGKKPIETLPEIDLDDEEQYEGPIGISISRVGDSEIINFTVASLGVWEKIEKMEEGDSKRLMIKAFEEYVERETGKLNDKQR